MTPYFLGQISPNPLVEGDQYQSHLPPFTLATDATSFSFPILFSNPQDQGVSDRDHHTQRLLLQQQSFDPLLIGGSSDRPAPFPTSDVGNGCLIERDRYVVREEDPRASGKWMSSKMRIMRKMMDSDRIVVGEPRANFQVLQDQLQPINQGSTSGNEITASCGIIRVCSDCNTTKTPLWRSGPRGPKSLCNACGIRQRKARRAMAAAAVGGGLAPSEKPSKVRKEKRSDADRTVPFKKRYKIAAAETSQTKLRFDDITISLSKDSAFHRVFPQDERDAAILLMALSCGLISR